MKINVNKTIIVNGHKYSSPEEMPEELRRAYEAAMAAGGPGRLMKASGVKASISFNGKQFASADSMPPEMRRLYELAMAAADTEATPPPQPPAGIAPPKGLIEKDGVFVKARPSADEILQSISRDGTLRGQMSSQLLRVGLVLLGLIVLGVVVVFLER